mmetsp:Transcript_1533/g.3414  ORF Transcript_1533/g.3414 Transcript_1533/m.3414 type:complete len:170 (+) Transcript_1533:121-630(+)
MIRGDSNGGKSNLCSAGWPLPALVFKLASSFLRNMISLFAIASRYFKVAFSVSNCRTFNCSSSMAAFFLSLEAAALLLFFSFLSNCLLSPSFSARSSFTAARHLFFDVVVSHESPEHCVSVPVSTDDPLPLLVLFFEQPPSFSCSPASPESSQVSKVSGKSNVSSGGGR